MEVAGRSTTGGLPMPQKKRKKLLKLVDGFSSMSAFLPSTTSTHTPHTKRAKDSAARAQERVQAATGGDSSPLGKSPATKRKKDKDSLVEGFSTMADLINSQDADRGDTAKGTTARDQERVQAATSGDSSPLRKFPSKKRKKDKDSLMEGFSTMADLVNSQDADRGDTAEDLAARAQESLQPDSSGDSSAMKKSHTKKRKKDRDTFVDRHSAMADLVKTEDTDCGDAAEDSATRAQERLQSDTSGDSSSVKKSPTKKRKKDRDSLVEGFSTMADLVKAEDADHVDAAEDSATRAQERLQAASNGDNSPVRKSPTNKRRKDRDSLVVSFSAMADLVKTEDADCTCAAEDLAARAQESLQPDSSGDSSSVKKSPTKKRKKDMDSWGEGFSAMADLVKTEDTDCVDATDSLEGRDVGDSHEPPQPTSRDDSSPTGKSHKKKKKKDRHRAAEGFSTTTDSSNIEYDKTRDNGETRVRDDQTPAQPSNSLHTSPRKSHKKKKKNDGDDAAERFSAMADLSNSEPDTVRNQFMGCLGLRAADTEQPMITSVDDDLQPSNDVEARRKEKKKRKNKDKDREESGFSITAGHGGREPEAAEHPAMTSADNGLQPSTITEAGRKEKTKKTKKKKDKDREGSRFPVTADQGSREHNTVTETAAVDVENTHTVDKQKCYVCREPVSGKEDYVSHLAERHRKYVSQCPKCLCRLASQDQIDQHLATVCRMKNTEALVGVFRCCHCPLVYSRRRSLWRHVATEHKKTKNVLWTCQHCGKEMTSKHRADEHKQKCVEGLLKQRKKDGDYPCNTCGQHFTAKDSLYYHRRTIHDGHVFECLCGMQFRTSSRYYAHKSQCR